MLPVSIPLILMLGQVSVAQIQAAEPINLGMRESIMNLIRHCLARARIAQLFLHWGRPNPKIALRPAADDAIEWPCWSPVQWR